MDVIGVYQTTTGEHIDILPASSWSWRRTVSAAGSVAVDIPLTQESVAMNLRGLLAPWRTTLAIRDNATGRVVAAGVVYARQWEADTGMLKVSCADLWDLFKLRLVIDPSLDSFGAAAVEEKEGAIPGAWTRRMSGSLGDIARQLVEMTIKAGPLPIILPAHQGGQHERTYEGGDMATIASRLSELTQVIDGPEIAFAPSINPISDRLEWQMMIGTPELVTASHRWDARRRAIPLIDISVEEDASDMVGDSWARGGSQNDRVLIAHHHDRWLEQAGWPLLQAADTSHSTISDLTTLAAWARTPTRLRSESVEVIQLKARRQDEAGYALADALTPGDHILLRHDDPYLGAGLMRLKVLELSGDEGEWVGVSCREIVEV